MPDGKNTASRRIEFKLPALIKDPFLSLYVDSDTQLGDLVLDDTLTLEQIIKIIEKGEKKPYVFGTDGITLNTKNTVDMLEIVRLLFKQQYPYTPREPIDIISSRPYTGIIIDARGSLPVQGEYISSIVSPCFFPEIWNEDMDLIFERDMVEQQKVNEYGIVHYDYSDDRSRYENLIGTDPLFIKAEKVYGKNRTDPVIKTDEALRILTVPENKDLLKQGKVVILLNKEQLIHDVSVPQRDNSYYAAYNTVKNYFFEDKVPDVTIQDTINGILFSVDLKFKPDSPELLSTEKPRITKIAEALKKIIADNEFSILVEGHTADIGKPVGQKNLSIERTRTVMKALIADGLPESLFSYYGYGATRPVASNTTESGRAQNRRVDITARPKATYIQRDW